MKEFEERGRSEAVFREQGRETFSGKVTPIYFLRLIFTASSENMNHLYRERRAWRLQDRLDYKLKREQELDTGG